MQHLSFKYQEISTKARDLNKLWCNSQYQALVPGHLDRSIFSKQGSGHHIEFFKIHSLMNYFSNDLLKITEMFRIKDNFISHNDFCHTLKDLSRKKYVQVFFKANGNLNDFSRLHEP